MKKEEDKPELSEEDRKEIYKEVCKIQDSLSPDDPNYRNKQQEAYPKVATQHQLSEEEVRQICIEGATKNWATA